MTVYKRLLGVVLAVTILWASMTSNIYAQLAENIINFVQEQDEELIRAYVEYVNTQRQIQLPELFCETQSVILSDVLKEESNHAKNASIYNVTQINKYEVNVIENSNAYEYSEYEDIAEYLLYFECQVKESDVFFKEGDNYFKLVVGTEDSSRKILELSVAPNNLLDQLAENNGKIISVDDVEKYTDERAEIINNMDGYELNAVGKERTSYSEDPVFTPTTLSSYTFPSTILILNTSSNTICARNFKNYCYVVCAAEFGVGTDGVTYAHNEALKAFALCVRNVGWYRSIYPINATAGYYVTDDSETQTYDWTKESTVATEYPRHISAVEAIWDVMMFDGAKKLFYPSYRSGYYNANTASDFSKFYQNGANYLATEWGYNYPQILHHFYDAAIGEQISEGPIIVCTSHLPSLFYTKTMNGHGKECLTCGHLILSSHTWVAQGIYGYRCSVCGFESDHIYLE